MSWLSKDVYGDETRGMGLSKETCRRWTICGLFLLGGLVQKVLSVQEQMEIPSSEFAALRAELERQPIPLNRYRVRTGSGRSQTWGIVNKRCLPPDYSRLCWGRPYLYKLLLDFGAKWVDLSWNAVTVNDNYKAGPHRDKHNIGNSFLVAFGSYEGGELELLEGDSKGLYDVCQKPLLHDFKKDLHRVRDWTGQRYSLVYYWCDTRGQQLPPATVKEENGKWCFYRGDTLVTKDSPLPHPKVGVSMKSYKSE